MPYDEIICPSCGGRLSFELDALETENDLTCPDCGEKLTVFTDELLKE